MRKVGLFGEAVGSRICTSCLLRIASSNGFSGLARMPLESWKLIFAHTQRNASRRIHSHTTRKSRGERQFSAIPKQNQETVAFDLLNVRQGARNPDSDHCGSDSSPKQEVEPKIDVRALLEEAQPGKIQNAFNASPEFQRSIHELPAPTFVEALRIISPEYFIEPHKQIQRDLHPTTAYNNRILPLRTVLAKVTSHLNHAVMLRRHAGHSLGLAEYTHLLSCFASMGYEREASRVWTEMTEDGIEPNVDCYNFYMEAKIWDGTYVAKENHRLRSTPWVYAKREKNPQNPGYRGYRTGEDGVRDQVHRLFDTMITNGLVPNETTFIHIMTAAGREWDLRTVKSTLQTVWGIDVDLLENDPNSHPPLPVFSTSSPLHPTTRLLYAVAHIFGSNNDFATALKLVDFISQKYGVAIPQSVWQELLDWSLVLSLDRFGKNADQNSIGKIPRDSPLQLLDVITSPPYNSSLSLKMCHIAVKINWIKQSDSAFEYMRAGREIFLTSLRSRNKLFRKLLRMHSEAEPVQQTSAASQPGNPHDSSLIPDSDSTLPKPAYQYHLTPLRPSLASSGAYWELYNTVNLLNIKVSREALYLQRWIRLVLTRRKWSGTREGWERRGIQKFIAEWKDFLPYRVFYHMKGGIVEFEPSSFWPDGHKWNLASFTLPLGDCGKRFHQEHFRKATANAQLSDNSPAAVVVEAT